MFDFPELFTKSARQILPIVLARKLSFSFDCSSATVHIRREDEPFRAALHRLFLGTIELAGTGFVSFTATSRTTTEGMVEVCVSAGCVGELAPAEEVEAISRRLGLRLERPVAAAATAVGHWKLLDAAVQLHVVPGEGALLTMVIRLQDATLVEPPRVWAQEARAWLVNADPILAAAWSRRFQRLGWAVSRFASYEAAVQQLKEQPDSARPAIVVAVESGDPETDGTASLPLALPSWTRLIYAVPAGSPALQDPGSPEGYTVRVIPFSPNDLREFTEELDHIDLASGTTIPAPLALANTRRVLIVDDSPVNLVVGRGLVESLGYAVDTAENGLQAIDSCISCAPDVILMDIEMPQMNGLDATLRLRELQSMGRLAPFAIVALTASFSPEMQGACLAIGMEDCLPKPIEIQRLARCIRRVVTLR